MTDQEVLKWTLTKIMAAQNNKIFGSVIIKLEKGCIVCVKTETTEQPPRT